MESLSDNTPKRGRPSALDEVKRREICALITVGCSLEGAARYVGCTASTIRREARRNQQFNDEMRRASTSAAISPLQAVREAARKYWRAGAWLLERIDPQRFGKQDVRHMKPEHFKESISLLASIVREEVVDPDMYARIARRFEELAKVTERELWADRDTAPRPRRRRQKR